MIYIKEDNWFDENTSEDIPYLPGVYCFWLAPYRLSNLGLSEKKLNERKVSPLQLRNVLTHKSRNVSKFLTVNELKGSLSNTKSNSNLKVEYDLCAIRKENDSFINEIDNLTDDEIFEYLMLLESINFFAIPIYIGITVEQTLQQRYNQHKVQYDSEYKNNTFGARLRKSSLKWRDLVFSCYFQNKLPSYKQFRLLEKHLHSMMHPVLSEN